MQTSVTFKNLEPSDHLKTYVIEKLDRFDRFLDSPVEASVVLLVEKFRHIAEINLVGDGMRINGKEETEDMYSAIDMVLDKIEKQIKKSKQKTREKRTKGKQAKPMEVIAETRRNEESAEVAEEYSKRVMVKNIEYKPMDVDEAIMQMDLGNENFLVFTNSRTDQINVLYHRKDGNYGLIQPQS